MHILQHLCLRLLWRAVLALGLSTPAWVHAQAIQCDSVTFGLSATPAASYTYLKGQTTTLFTGRMTWTYTGCTQRSGLGWVELVMISPTARSLSSGVLIQGFNYSITPSGCSWTIAPWGPVGADYGATITHKPSRCASLTFDVDFKIFTNGGGTGGSYSSATATTPKTAYGGWIFGGGGSAAFTYTPTFSTVFQPLGCTLSTTNTTVTLPRVSTHALSGGSGEAATTAFDIGLTGCTTAGSGYLASATWSFATGPQTNLIANSASAPVAANVYMQLLDASLNPIANNGKSTLTAIEDGQVSGTARHYARYASPGSPGTGNVKGIAQLTLSFN